MESLIGKIVMPVSFLITFLCLKISEKYFPPWITSESTLEIPTENLKINLKEMMEAFGEWEAWSSHAQISLRTTFWKIYGQKKGFKTRLFNI